MHFRHITVEPYNRDGANLKPSRRGGGGLAIYNHRRRPIIRQYARTHVKTHGQRRPPPGDPLGSYQAAKSSYRVSEMYLNQARYWLHLTRGPSVRTSVRPSWMMRLRTNTGCGGRRLLLEADDDADDRGLWETLRASVDAAAAAAAAAAAVGVDGDRDAFNARRTTALCIRPSTAPLTI